MDLGIKGLRAVVTGSSKGLGYACARALAQEGAVVVINGRDPERLAHARDALIKETGSEIIAVVADISTKKGRASLIKAGHEPHILVNNNSGPTPGRFESMDEEAWLEAIQANMVAPIMLTQAFIPGMKKKRFGRIINITSAMVTTPRPHMSLSSGARAGLTAVMKGQSLELAKHNITINNLLPERFDTDRQIQMAHLIREKEGISFEEARQRQIDSIAANRLGQPSEFGATCAFVCSVHAGFMSGQNLHLDGGSYPSLI